MKLSVIIIGLIFVVIVEIFIFLITGKKTKKSDESIDDDFDIDTD